MAKIHLARFRNLKTVNESDIQITLRQTIEKTHTVYWNKVAHKYQILSIPLNNHCYFFIRADDAVWRRGYCDYFATMCVCGVWVCMLTR